jgi:hypothetical protein
LQELHVDPRWLLGEHVDPSARYTCDPAADWLNEAGLLQERFRPRNPIGDERLRSAGKGLGAFFGREPKLVRHGSYEFTKGVLLTVAETAEYGQHQRLKVRDCHGSSRPFYRATGRV